MKSTVIKCSAFPQLGQTSDSLYLRPLCKLLCSILCSVDLGSLTVESSKGALCRRKDGGEGACILALVLQ